MSTPDEAGFRQLWPVLLLERALPTHERANDELERVVLARDAERAERTTAYRDDNLFSLDHPAIRWLRECIGRTARDYCRRAGMDAAIDWRLHGWANLNRLGDYHDPHNHPYAYLSGTYYVRVPSDRATTENRADVRPGCITFYDPRGAMNMTAIRDDPQSNPEFTVVPRPGTILLWPSALLHFVHPNLSASPRISISFNLMIANAGDLLPREG